MPSASRAPESLRVRVRLRRQDLEHVARAAAIDSALPNSVPPIATRSQRSPSRSLVLGEDGGDVLGHPPRAERDAARDRLAAGQEVRVEAPRAVSPPGPTTCVWVSSAPAACPCSRVSRRSALVEAGVGQDQAVVVRQAPARSARARRPGDRAPPPAPPRSLNGTSTRVAVTSRAGRAPRARAARRVQLDEGLVEVPVVLAVEHQDLVASGQRPGRRGSTSVLAWRRRRACTATSAARSAGPSSSETTIASSVGSRNWLPRAIRSLTAARPARARSRRTSTCRRC